MRLIDADYVKQRIQETMNPNYVYSIVSIQNLICEAPTIDAVQVVRCKDCVYHGDFNDGWCACENTGAGMPKDGFCSDGERDEVEG